MTQLPAPPPPRRAAPPPTHPTPPPASRAAASLQGFDEYMNVVLDDAEEVDAKRHTRTPLGRLLLKGDNITLITGCSSGSAPAAAGVTG